MKKLVPIQRTSVKTNRVEVEDVEKEFKEELEEKEKEIDKKMDARQKCIDFLCYNSSNK